MPANASLITHDQPDGVLAQLQTEEGHFARLSHDDDCPQPYDGDDAVRIVVLHRRYIDPAGGACGSTPEDVAAWEADNAEEWFTIALFLYDHSGTVYRTGHSNPFHCPWDSGRVGIIALKRSEWPVGHDSPSLEEQAAAIADEYTKWANGETYACAIYDADGELQDSCGGFVGLDSAMAYAREMFALIFTKTVSYEIQHHTQCDGWVNTWTITEADGTETLETFSTIEAAQAALDEFFEDIRDEIEAGQRDADKGYDRSEFRIVEAGTA